MVAPPDRGRTLLIKRKSLAMPAHRDTYIYLPNLLVRSAKSQRAAMNMATLPCLHEPWSKGGPVHISVWGNEIAGCRDIVCFFHKSHEWIQYIGARQCAPEIGPEEHLLASANTANSMDRKGGSRPFEALRMPIGGCAYSWPMTAPAFWLQIQQGSKLPRDEDW